MPHCIIEYTRDVEKEINIEKLMNIAFESVDQSGLFDRAAIKARAIGYDYCKSGQDRNDYIHISLKILAGRTAEQKKQLSDRMMEAVKPYVGNTKSVTVEIIDMDKESYGKLLQT